MTDRLLMERVCAYVAAHPDETARQIARGVGHQYQPVRDVLGGPSFERLSVAGSRRIVYRVRGVRVSDGARLRGETPGDVSRRSQNNRLLSILADGRWHRSDELHRAVFCVLHSRVAELRRRGFLIEHKGGGPGADQHWYRLVSEPAERAA